MTQRTTTDPSEREVIGNLGEQLICLGSELGLDPQMACNGGAGFSGAASRHQLANSVTGTSGLIKTPLSRTEHVTKLLAPAHILWLFACLISFFCSFWYLISVLLVSFL